MLIDPTRRYIEYMLLLENMDEESSKRLREDAISVYGDPWSLPLRDFFALSKNDLSYIGVDAAHYYNATVRQFMWKKAFDECVKMVEAIVKKFQVPMTDEAKRASEQCEKMNFEESTLIFVRNYFGLRSFAEAENMPLSDYIVAKKDHYNNAMFKFAIGNIQRQKLSKK